MHKAYLSGSGLVIINIHKIAPEIAKIISIANENAKIIVIINVGIIIITEYNLEFLLIALLSCQLLIIGPNVLWLISQLSNFLDDVEKNQADNNISGVVGIPGKIIPINPKPTQRKPRLIYKYFFIIKWNRYSKYKIYY